MKSTKSKVIHATLLATVAALRLTQMAAAAETPSVSIPEIFRTQDWTGADVDSVAAWRGPDGSALLFITAKSANEIYVCNGLTGEYLKTVGEPGAGLGQLQRPNGIAVVDDLLFVVERDNRSIQVFQIPQMKPITSFGESVLINPYGLTVFRSGDRYEMYITDDYFARRPGRLPKEAFGARVKQFRIERRNGKLDVRFVRLFGETSGEGALRKVESILAEPARDRLLICDETANDIKVFNLDGRYLETVAQGVIEFEPEGLILYEDKSAPGGGWLMTADQGTAETILRVLSRDGKRHVMDITAKPTLANTDGITLLPGELGPFKKGVLYCVHNDKRVQAYSWSDVLEALK